MQSFTRRNVGRVDPRATALLLSLVLLCGWALLVVIEADQGYLFAIEIFLWSLGVLLWMIVCWIY